MNNKYDRRKFMVAGAMGIAALGMGPSAVLGIEPIKRGFGSQIKLSCAAYGYRSYLSGRNKTMDMMDFLDVCAKMGLGAAEATSYYFPPNADDSYFIQFRRKAFLLGLDISGTAIGNTFTYGPGAERDKQLALCNQWVDNAVLMGAPVIRIFAGTVPKGMTEAESIKNAIETTKIACEYAGKKGIFLALENHGGIVAKPETMLEIVNAVDSEWFGFNMDSGNFHSDDPYTDLEKIAPYAVNVQIKVDMYIKGKKVPADFKRVFKILDKAGYRGYAALEFEGEGEARVEIPKFIHQLGEDLKAV